MCFNIFEAIFPGKQLRKEHHHSDFLAFLLDPERNQGIGDLFLKELLYRSLIVSEGLSIPILSRDICKLSFDGIVVKREMNNIDIYLNNTTHNVIFILENKIDSKENGKQLSRYMDSQLKRHSESRIIGLYITLYGSSPTDSRYIPINYTQVCEALDAIIEKKSDAIDSDLVTLIRHYTKSIRRTIVNGTNTNQQTQISNLLDNLIAERNDLTTIWKGAYAYHDFILNEWGDKPVRANNEKGPVLYFETTNNNTGVNIKLYIPKIEKMRSEIRIFLHEMVNISGHPFNNLQKQITKNICIYEYTLLNNSKLNSSWPDIEMEISNRWERFVVLELAAIKPLVREWVKQLGLE